jgi:hypothetical protein
MKIIRVKVQIDAEQIEREVEDHGRAVAVLPYDPERHVVLLAQQLRVPILLADCNTELLEAAAGMVDAERPDETAAREASEGARREFETVRACCGSMDVPRRLHRVYGPLSCPILGCRQGIRGRGAGQRARSNLGARNADSRTMETGGAPTAKGPQDTRSRTAIARTSSEFVPSLV